MGFNSRRLCLAKSYLGLGRADEAVSILVEVRGCSCVCVVVCGCLLTLYQPMTHMCVMSSHKPIRIYMGFLILGVNTLYRLFCFFKLFPMVGKGLIMFCGESRATHS